MKLFKKNTNQKWHIPDRMNKDTWSLCGSIHMHQESLTWEIETPFEINEKTICQRCIRIAKSIEEKGGWI